MNKIVEYKCDLLNFDSKDFICPANFKINIIDAKDQQVIESSTVFVEGHDVNMSDKTYLLRLPSREEVEVFLTIIPDSFENGMAFKAFPQGNSMNWLKDLLKKI